MLQRKERFRRSSDEFVERRVLALLYCIAQWLRDGLDPPIEEAPLLFQIALLLRDQVAHRVAERRDVIFRLRRLVATRKPERRQLSAQRRKRHLVGVPHGISTRIQCDGRAPGSDEGRLVFLAHRLGVGARRGLRKLAPARRNYLVVRLELVRLAERGEQARVRRAVEETREQRIEVRPRLLLGREAHFGTSWMVASALLSIMSTTRQSPHICSRRVPPANIECPPSLPSMFSTICRVPNGLPQRTQSNGSASFSVTGSFACGPSASRGTSRMASSGQVLAQRPHCTQLRSMKRSRGASGESSSAASGQAPMQALHSVQLALFTVMAPNGAPALSGIRSFGVGACFAR